MRSIVIITLTALTLACNSTSAEKKRESGQPCTFIPTMEGGKRILFITSDELPSCLHPIPFEDLTYVEIGSFTTRVKTVAEAPSFIDFSDARVEAGDPDDGCRHETFVDGLDLHIDVYCEDMCLEIEPAMCETQ